MQPHPLHTPHYPVQPTVHFDNTQHPLPHPPPHTTQPMQSHVHTPPPLIPQPHAPHSTSQSPPPPQPPPPSTDPVHTTTPAETATHQPATSAPPHTQPAEPASASITTPAHPPPPPSVPRTTKPTPSIAPTLSTTRGIWRDPDRSPPRIPEHHRYSAFPAIPTSAPSQASSKSRSRTRSARSPRSPLPRRRGSATQSVASSQPHSAPADRHTSPPPNLIQDKTHTSTKGITVATTTKHTPGSAHRTSGIILKPNPLFTPKHTTKKAPTPPPAEPPTIPVQRRPHNLPSPKFQPPTDPAQLEVFQWINQYAQSLDVHNEPMISYVAKVLSAAHLNSTHFTDMQLLTHTQNGTTAPTKMNITHSYYSPSPH